MRCLRNVAVASLVVAWAQPGTATAAPAAHDAEALAALVAARVANEGRVGTMHFLLENDSGSVRRREALMLHSERHGEERIAIFFTAPAMIEETAFLSFNRDGADADENWLFLPATDRVRRLPASDRGDYFMGTDLTFGDIQDNFKFDARDWRFGLGGDDADGDTAQPVLTGVARSTEIARETGYGAFRARIDTDTGFPTWIEYSDRDGDPLKRVEVLEIREVGAAQTAMRFVVHNLQTGHTTRIHFTDMRHVPDLDDAVFEPEALAYGIPDIED